MSYNYIIVSDSAIDADDKINEILMHRIAPFTINVNGNSYYDDETVDIDALLKDIAADKNPAKTAAPSPNDFVKWVDETVDGVFILTISSRLSGSYNSAMTAAELIEEKYPNCKTHVVDSKSTGPGQITLMYHIKECIDKGMVFEEIRDSVEAYRDNDQLFFILDNLDTLIKNGRMSLLKGKIASFLHIKPVLCDNGEGNIGLKDQARTYSKSLEKMAKCVAERREKYGDKLFVITYCNAYDRALELKALVEERCQISNIMLVKMQGLCTTYANDGGLICSI